METQQIVFWVWKPKKNRYTKIPEPHIGGIEDISQKMLKKKLQRLSEFWLDKRANIFEDIRMELGLYLSLYSSNRELLVPSRRGTAKIPEFIGVLYSHKMLNRAG